MNEKRPEDFEIEDFVSSESFINYHLRINTTDQLFWENWLSENPDKKLVTEEAIKMLDRLLMRLPVTEYQQELEKMKARIDESAPLPKNIPSIIRYFDWNRRNADKSQRLRRMRWAIPVIMLLAVLLFFLQRSYFTGVDDWVVKHNTEQLPMKFLLGDSTEITLAPNSTLKFRAHFGDADRKVFLEGAASFHVKRDEAHPFKVYDHELVATVLGTIFNVHGQHGDSVLLVELLKGSVRVEGSDGAKSIILSPNERVIFTRQDGSMYKENWVPSNIASVSQENHLVFQKNSFEEIALKIKSTFGMTLINNSIKKSWSFTGEFNNMTAKDVIENICQVEGLKYQIKSDTIIIK